MGENLTFAKCVFFFLFLLLYALIGDQLRSKEPTEIRTRDGRFKVFSANHYTMGSKKTLVGDLLEPLCSQEQDTI